MTPEERQINALALVIADLRQQISYERDMQVAAEHMALEARTATGELRRERDELMAEVEEVNGFNRELLEREENMSARIRILEQELADWGCRVESLP